MPWWKAVSFTVLLVLMLAAGLFFIINTAWREDRQREANMAYCRPFEMFYAKKLLIEKGINPEKVYFDEF